MHDPLLLSLALGRVTVTRLCFWEQGREGHKKIKKWEKNLLSLSNELSKELTKRPKYIENVSVCMTALLLSLALGTVTVPRPCLWEQGGEGHKRRKKWGRNLLIAFKMSYLKS